MFDRIETAPNRERKLSSGPNHPNQISDWRATVNGTRTCSIDDCTHPPRRRGLCQSHLQRLLRDGDSFDRSLIPERAVTCTAGDCVRAAYRVNLCTGHYGRHAKYGENFDRSPIIMPIRACAVDGCDHPHYARKLCFMHYDRDRNHRLNPDARRYHTGSYFDRLFDRIDADASCWEWMGGLSRGYGVMRFEGKSGLVHRRVWELLVGAVPEGLELDHLCRNHRCCNPDHLEPVTHAENMRRGAVGSVRSTLNRTRRRAA